MNTNFEGVEIVQHWKTFSHCDKMYGIIWFVISSYLKWASLMVALSHTPQLLIIRGTEKPVACHELACPLEA